MTRNSNVRLAILTLLAFAALVAWDATGADLALARMAGTPMGFPLRENGFLVEVMHKGARDLSWLIVFGLFAAIRWPVGFLRRLTMPGRAQLALTVLASVLAVSLIKQSSHTSCPWDLNEFGGVAHYVSHWSWGVRDGGPGGCFPAGHASAAFAYVGGYFVLRRVSPPSVARIWLGVALLVGLALGWSQQLRGAHYMSHTLWSGWVCWVVGFAIELVVTLRKSALPKPAAAQHAGP
jgi:membrane-associated PAP2 superfamily phosphatase